MKGDRKYWREETRMDDHRWLWVNKHGKLSRRGWIRLDPAEGEVPFQASSTHHLLSF